MKAFARFLKRHKYILLAYVLIEAAFKLGLIGVLGMQLFSCVPDQGPGA